MQNLVNRAARFALTLTGGVIIGIALKAYTDGDYNTEKEEAKPARPTVVNPAFSSN